MRAPHAIAKVLCLLCLMTEQATAEPLFMGLGDLALGNATSSTGFLGGSISSDGLVVVGSSGSGSGTEAFRWTSSDGMVGLGDLPGGTFSSAARGASSDGTVVVGVGQTSAGGEAFRWTATQGMTGLGVLPGTSSTSAANSVSADGSVVVGEAVSSLGFEAFRWTESDGMVGLGSLGGMAGGNPGPFLSRGRDVSADGSLSVGMAINSSSRGEAFLWDASNGMTGLGDLPGGTFFSEAYAISADGSTVVGQANSGGNPVGGDEGFVWTASGGMVGLGDLAGGATRSGARDVSADGSVVVGFGATPSQASAAVVWDSVNGIQELSVLLTALGLDLTGWRLDVATGVSADGLTISGHGINPSGQTEAWIAVIPEPSAALLISMGLAVLARRPKAQDVPRWPRVSRSTRRR